MIYEIEKEKYEKCYICGKELTEIKKEVGGTGIYFPQAFLIHIKQHGITKEEYFEKITERPICLCGFCNKPTKLSRNGSRLFWTKYACGRYPGSLKWFEEAKEKRKGAGNPMFNKKPWNKGLTADTDDRVMHMVEKAIGRKIPYSSRRKMSIAAKKRKIHGHTNHKHSEETIKFLRENTIRMHKSGKYKHTNTFPFREVCRVLEKNGIIYETEKVEGFYSFDIYIPCVKLYIEVDGDFFHVNPIKYPSGPISKIQKRNLYNDKKKNEYAIKNNINLKRIWEYDIVNNIEKVEEDIKCTVKKLLDLKK